MKSIKFSLLSMVFVTGSLFAMEDQESADLNLSVQNELWAAIEKNDPEKVKNALENGANPNEFKCNFLDDNRTNGNDNYTSPLSQAIINFFKNHTTKESITIVQSLLEKSADPSCIEYRTCRENNKEVAKKKLSGLCIIFFFRDVFLMPLNDSLQIPVYPLVKLLYGYSENPKSGIIYEHIESNEKLSKNIKETIQPTLSIVLGSLQGEQGLLLKNEWIKAALLVVPEIVEDKEFESNREVLEEIRNTIRDEDLKNFTSKLNENNIFMYLQKRQLGMSSRRNNNLFSSETNNSNNNGKKEELESTSSRRKRKTLG